MKSTSRRLRLAALLLVAAAAASAALPFRAEDASACAILPIAERSRPNLTLERVAILYDDSKTTEHFIREVRFDGASSAFAFVVPTPAKPELESITGPLFERLATDFPLYPPPPPPSSSDKSARSEAATASAGVTVLAVEQIGSFTAFILAANDTTALDQWLKDNSITLPAGGREWLDHYVGLSFFFTAFRFNAPPQSPDDEGAPPSDGQFAKPPGEPGSDPGEPPEDGPPRRPWERSPKHIAMKSETVRLSFRTPVPFYPYLEPAFDSSTMNRPRDMEIWLISRQKRAPMLRRFARDHAPRWGFAWNTQMAYEREADDVSRPLGELHELLPANGHLHIQTFHDSRINRDGWSDIVFPAGEKGDDDSAWRATATSLLGDLNRGIQEGYADPWELDHEAKFRLPPGSGGCGCRLAGEEEAGSFAGWLVLGGIALVATRRARIGH